MIGTRTGRTTSTWDYPSQAFGGFARARSAFALVAITALVLGTFSGILTPAAWAGELRLPQPGDDVVPGRFLVVMKPDDAVRAAGAGPSRQTADAADVLEDLTGTVPRPVGRLGVFTIDVPSGPGGDAGGPIRPAGVGGAPAEGLDDDTLATLQAVAALPDVDVVEPDYRRHRSAYTPSDPLVGQLYYLTLTGATTAFRPGLSGNAPVIVAVLDDGVYWDHPDLAGRMWTNTREIPENGRDDDGNGYIDDVHGYDFANRDGHAAPDYSIADRSWESHGTHIAGTIAATWDNGVGIAGLSNNVRIMSCKFFGNGPGGGSVSAAAEGVTYAVNNGAKLINCSFGGSGRSATEERAIQYARSRGVLLICAAGNESSNIDLRPSYPAAFEYDNVISVAASDSSDQLASFSNFGATNVDLAAPGRSILSTVVSGPSGAPQPGYASWNGTSMAAPMVTGALAMALDREPGRDPFELRGSLLSSADRLPQLAGRVASGGRLNVARLVGSVDPSQVPLYSEAYSQAAHHYSYAGYVYAYYGYALENPSASAYYAFAYGYYSYIYAYWAEYHAAYHGRDATYVVNYRYNQAVMSYYAYVYGLTAYAEVPGVYLGAAYLNNYTAFIYGWADYQLF